MTEYSPKISIAHYDADLCKLASSFHCGNTHIDSFLRGADSLSPEVGHTYVWLNEDKTTIIGFYNITTGYIEQESDGRRYKIGGAIHINDFALDEKYQGMTMGDGSDIHMSDLLMLECLERIEYIRQKHVGFTFVTLCSTDKGKRLYRRHQFDNLEEDMNVSPLYGNEDQAIPMYLALGLE